MTRGRKLECDVKKDQDTDQSDLVDYNVILNKQAYHPPVIKQLGTLEHLIMGASGNGLDSIARREF